MSIISSWDYVDPKIARTLISLDNSHKRIQQNVKSIEKDHKLPTKTKLKLLSQTKQVESKIKQLLKRQKDGLVEYYDKQILITTKEKYYDSKNVPTLNLNKSVYREEQSTIDHSKIMDQMKSVPTTISDRRDKKQHMISVREFLTANSQQINTNGNQFQINSLKRRLKKKLNRKNSIIQSLRKSNFGLKKRQQLTIESFDEVDSVDLREELQQYKQKDEQNQQYISLLKDKIEKMTLHYEKKQKELKAKLKQYSDKLEEIMRDQVQLQDIKTENDRLKLERQQLLVRLRRCV